MPTESDRIGQNDRESKLTARQLKFLPVLLASPTYAAACKAGRVSRDTLYEWLRQPQFKAELGRQRDELVTQSFALLSQSVGKAVEALVGLPGYRGRPIETAAERKGNGLVAPIPPRVKMAFRMPGRSDSRDRRLAMGRQR